MYFMNLDIHSDFMQVLNIASYQEWIFFYVYSTYYNLFIIETKIKS
jgi:hypothetical protein